MPELPEVQTVLDTLETQIKDLEIVNIKILYKPIVECSDRTFKKKLIGQHFRSFKRRGKYLLFEMDDITLVSHLRMEGKYFILDESVPLNKHDHVIFYLSNGKQLRYNDVRKFGKMLLIKKDKIKGHTEDFCVAEFAFADLKSSSYLSATQKSFTSLFLK